MRGKSSRQPPPAATAKTVTPGRGTAPTMRPAKAHRGNGNAATSTVVVLRLYIANNAPNSVQAVANLEAICREHLKDAYELEIIDIFEYPQRALADGILVTPSLAKISPAPATCVVGNLSNRGRVLRALGIMERAR